MTFAYSDGMSELVGSAPRLAIDRAGEGEAVLFLHGIGGNRRNWRSQLPVFAQRFLAVSFDARGYGDSDDYDGPLHFPDFADDAARILDHLGIGRAHIVGLSMGGNVAIDFAHRHRERVLSLVLCDTDHGTRDAPEEARQEFLRLRSEPLLNGQTMAEIAPALARSLTGPQADAAAQEAIMESLLRLRADNYLKSIRGTIDIDLTDAVDSIRAPTLIVVGEHDALTPVSEAQYLHSRIRGSRLAIIPGAGHLSNIEAPGFFNEVVMNFLAGIQ